MNFKSALVLCAVSIFCACDARLPPPYYNEDYYYSPSTTDRSRSDYRPSPLTRWAEQKMKEWNGKGFRVDDLTKKFYVSKDAKNWFDASDACKKMGMVLASPTTRFEENEIEDYLERNGLNPINRFDGYWLGGSRVSHDEPWQGQSWTWESNGQEVRSFGWMPGEPNGYDGEDCTEFKKDYNSKGWNNYFCIETRRYICQAV